MKPPITSPHEYNHVILDYDPDKSIPDSIGLLTEGEHYRSLKDRRDLDILDLGCRIPTFLWRCHHIFHCRRLIGVDIGSQQRCMADLCMKMAKDDSPAYNKFRTYQTLFEWYTNCIVPDISEGEPPLITDQNEFDQSFKIHFLTDIVDFLPLTNERFDIINISNVLHFMGGPDEVGSIMLDVKRLLRPNGIVTIRIQNDPSDLQRQDFNYSHLLSTLKNIFPGGTATEYREDGNWKIMTFCNFSTVSGSIH